MINLSFHAQQHKILPCTAAKDCAIRSSKVAAFFPFMFSLYAIVNHIEVLVMHKQAQQCANEVGIGCHDDKAYRWRTGG